MMRTGLEGYASSAKAAGVDDSSTSKAAIVHLIHIRSLLSNTVKERQPVGLNADHAAFWFSRIYWLVHFRLL